MTYFKPLSNTSLTMFTLVALMTSANTMAETHENLATGGQNFANFCLSCHNSETPHESRIAPPMIAIQKHYLRQDTSEQEFITAITDFVLKPNKDNSRMPGAVRKFGLMPDLGLTADLVKPIASFLYRTPMAEPDWFKAHHQQQKPTPLSYLQQGQQYALATKAVLGKNLMTAIKTKGTAEALAFCNEQAIQLTDQVATEHQVKIKRVSDKNRNPANQANQAEMNFIQSTKAKLIAGEKITGKTTELEDKVVAYYPIKSNDMCLQCHGTPAKDISADTMEKIKTLYPNDSATGYQSNELRGIWVVEMPKIKGQ
jgi:cytochrome c553